jgi:CHAD domain-containing protein
MGAEPSAVRVPRTVIALDLPIADSARLALATGLAAMKFHESAAIAGEIEPLHQMRVATRRLRATVRLFGGVIHGSRVGVYERDLPWLGQAAGAVREYDVIEALIRDCGDHLDPALAAALPPLADAIAANRKAEHARFVNDLRTKRYDRMCVRLADPLLRRALPSTDVGCYAPAMIAPIARSVRKAGKQIARDAPPELFHRLRVRIKRLRYALEMLIELGGKRSRKVLMRLEQMQELLGIHQDAVATMAWLRSYAGSAPGVAPETLMAVGATLQALVEQRRKLAVRAYRQWRRIAHSGIIDGALEEICRAAQRRLESARQAERQAQTAAATSMEGGTSDVLERTAPEVAASDSSIPSTKVLDPPGSGPSASALPVPAPDTANSSVPEAGVSESAMPGYAPAAISVEGVPPDVQAQALPDVAASNPLAPASTATETADSADELPTTPHHSES